MGNSDYTVAASNVTVAVGTATVNVAANGTGTGVGAGAPDDRERREAGGDRCGVVALGGVLTVVVPTPVPRGSTLLADFTGVTWVGAKPTLVLMDAQGNVLEESKQFFFSATASSLSIRSLGSILLR